LTGKAVDPGRLNCCPGRPDSSAQCISVSHTVKGTVIGACWVGLVTGVCRSVMGNHMVCLHAGPRKISVRRRGQVPMHAPGLDVLMWPNVAAGRLSSSQALWLLTSTACCSSSRWAHHQMRTDRPFCNTSWLLHAGWAVHQATGRAAAPAFCQG